MLDMIQQMDAGALLYIQDNIRNSFLTPILKTITHLGDAGIFWILLTIALLCFKKTRRAGFYSLLALVGSLVINNLILKLLVNRTRPYDCVVGLTPLVKRLIDSSFPSGHSSASFASATALYFAVPKKYSVPLLILAALIALSRLYVGVHFPTDVLVGSITGALIGWGASIWGNKLLERRAEREEAVEE